MHRRMPRHRVARGSPRTRPSSSPRSVAAMVVAAAHGLAGSASIGPPPSRRCPCARGAAMPEPEVRVTGAMLDRFDEILTPDALRLLGQLESQFGARRRQLIADREVR